MKEAIRAQALAEGFDAVGFASAECGWGDELNDYLGQGLHQGMAWMAETASRRASPQALWPEAKSVVALGLSYAPNVDPLANLARPERANISVYARNRDYHDVVKKRLKSLGGWMARRFGGELKVFVDTAPVMEKPLAARAGLGWPGRHGNIVSRRFGGWLVLGEIFTTLEIAPDRPEPNRCGSCRACQDACPTGAITGFGRVETGRCISYLTIEHKGEIPHDLAGRFGNRIYGCDDCLAACPWNKFAPPHARPEFRPRPELDAPALADLAQLDDAGFRSLFAGSPVKRIGHQRFLRNVAIAIGNGG